MVYTAELQLEEGENELVVTEHRTRQNQQGEGKDAAQPVHQEILRFSV